MNLKSRQRESIEERERIGGRERFGNARSPRRIVRTMASALALATLLAILAPMLAACGRPAVAAKSMAAPAAAPADTAAALNPAASSPSSGSGQATAPQAWPYRFTDDTGASVSLPRQPQRVAALMGSYAETWLLAGGRLAGVTSDALSERNLSLEPDVAMIGSVKDPSLERLLALAPDFVILSTDIDGHRKLDAQLNTLAIPHAYFQVEHFDDYLDMLRILTDITGSRTLYEQNGLAVQARIRATLSRTTLSRTGNSAADASRIAGARPKILLIRAFSGGAKARKADTMAGRMLAELGCDNIADGQPSLLDELSLEAVIAEDPDFIFVVTMGEDTEKALAGLRNGVQQNPAWNRLKAVRSGHYAVLPKELFHYKPNARWDEAYSELARMLGRVN